MKFGKASMQTINVLSIERISAEDRARIEVVDPGNVTSGVNFTENQRFEFPI